MIYKPLPPYAGTLSLPSGRWAWIAYERGDFVNVSFQHLERSADLMEAAVDKFDFATGVVDEMGREPLVRWWHDLTTDIIWELRVRTRAVPARIPGFARRELVFHHVGMDPRRVLLPVGACLGELTDDEIRQLNRNAHAETASSVRPDQAGGQVGTA
jgi:hypothetical protein